MKTNHQSKEVKVEEQQPEQKPEEKPKQEKVEDDSEYGRKVQRRIKMYWLIKRKLKKKQSYINLNLMICKID